MARTMTHHWWTACLAAIALTGVACQDMVTADFSATPLTGEAPLTVAFEDASMASRGEIVSWAWDFGDPGAGEENTSALENPEHTYTQPGAYSVSLTAMSSRGEAFITKDDYIVVMEMTGEGEGAHGEGRQPDVAAPQRPHGDGTE